MRDAPTTRSLPLFDLALYIMCMGAMGATFSLAVGDLLHLNPGNGVAFLLLIVFGLATYPVVGRVVHYAGLWVRQRGLPRNARWRLIAFISVFAASLFFAQFEAHQPLGMVATGWHVGLSVAWGIVSMMMLTIPARPPGALNEPAGADIYIEEDRP